MKGDRIEVVVDTGGATATYSIEATRAGRRVEVSNARGGVVEVTEVTRTGNPVRVGRFMASRVVALVEHPAGDEDEGAAAAAGPRASRRRRAPGSEQQSLI